jgi:hypothetical protein
LCWLIFGLEAQAQVTVQTIGGGPRVNSCATWAGFRGGNTYTNAQFNGPYASALDSQGNLWIADFTNSDVEEISQAGNLGASTTTELDTVETITNGKGQVSFSTNFHPFPKVTGVAEDAAGNLYVMMPTNGLLIKYDQYLNPLSAISFTSQSATPMATALLVDSSSNVFMSFANGMIISFRLVDGFPTPVYTNDLFLGGPIPMNYVVPAYNWSPVAMTLRTDGQLAVSDTLSNAIYLVTTNAGSTPVLLTGGNGAGWRDGTPNFAKFNQPHGIAASGDGRMVVCDTMNNRLRIIDTTNITTTLYGTDTNVWMTTCCSCTPNAYFAGWVDGVSGTSSTSASGREPVSVTISPTGTLFVTEQYYDLIRSVTGSGLTPVGVGATNATSTNAPPTVTFSPSSGYFPECVSISVTSTVPNVYYTEDGSTPTTNSAEVAMSFSFGEYVGSFEWCNPNENLTSLRIAAFNGTNSSPIAAGSSPSTNLVGFPASTQSGSGATAYIPVIVNLQSNTALKSLQFDVEITPNDEQTPMIQSLSLTPITPNDFLGLAGPAPGNTPVSFENFPSYTTPQNGVGLAVEASGTSSGMNIENFGVAVLLRVQIPPTAQFGQSYTLNVLYPSGTSDGVSRTVGLQTMAAQTLTITDPIALAGDSEPANGYNNGEFGNGELDNSDANAVLYALLNIRRPPSDSDAYKAMDVYPEAAGIIGDNFLTFLDWQTVVYRSLGLDTNNWIRFWTNGVLSHQQISWMPGGAPIPLSDTTVEAPHKLSLSAAPGLQWFCQVSIGAGVASYAMPGNVCSLPVYAKVLPGYSVSGMAFRAIAVASGGAPNVGQIQFTPANVSAPETWPGESSNDLICTWNLGGFNPPLTGSNYLGTISFQVPFTAQAGQSYALQFVVGGAAPIGGGTPETTTDYQMESFPGAAWVGSAPQQPQSLTSDEWKTYFFGSTTNALAADNADADGDGMPNWMEYLAGTNPTNAASCFQFTSATFNTNGLQGVALNWLTAPGKSYVLEAQTSLGGNNWTAINTNAGDGNYYQLLITNYSGPSRFYHILLQP